MMLSAWKRINLLRRELGGWCAALYLLNRLLGRFSQRSGIYYYQLVAQPLAHSPRLPPHRGRGFVLRVLQAPEPVLDRLERPMATIQQRFSQGAKCLIATKNGDLVGCIWFVQGAYAEDEVRVDYVLPTDGDCVWDFDVFVAEDQRLGFLFAKLWDAFDAYLRPLGVRYTVSRINAFNQRSMASHRRLGARACGKVLFVRFGKRQMMLSNLAPYVVLGGRPALGVSPEAG